MGSLGFGLTHQPPNRPFPPPGYFFPARSPFGAYQQVCARLSKDADSALMHAPRSPPISYFAAVRQVPFIPSPVGIGATSTASIQIIMIIYS